MFKLAKLYRDSGDLATADACATQGLAASQRVGDRYYVPRNLTILADLKARCGRIAEAKALYKHAEDVSDGMLGGDDSYWNSSIAAAMSQTYLQHFELVAKEADTAGAFQILERVRGRTLASALEDRKAGPRSGSTEAATLDSYVADTQTRLMQTNSPLERERLLDALAEYEWRLSVGHNAALQTRVAHHSQSGQQNCVVQEWLAALEIHRVDCRKLLVSRSNSRSWRRVKVPSRCGPQCRKQ